MRDRPEFEDYEPVLGEPVHEDVKRLTKDYCIDLKQKTSENESWRRDMFDEMMLQFDTWLGLRPPKLKWPRLNWEEAASHENCYNDYFKANIDNWKKK